MTAFRLADRMSRLGTESAFEVLARARALEAASVQGRILGRSILVRCAGARQRVDQLAQQASRSDIRVGVSRMSLTLMRATR